MLGVLPGSISKGIFDALKYIGAEGAAHNMSSNQDSLDKTIKDIEAIKAFEEPEDALKFILSQPVFQAYGGYNLHNMSDEEIIEIANDMLFAMRLSIEKLKR